MIIYEILFINSSKFSDKGFSLDAYSLTETKELFMYLCYGKYGMQQAVDIEISSRVMYRILVFGSRLRTRTVYITLDVKSPISPSDCKIYY